METYRLYFMSADGTHIDRFEPIEARDDDDAIRFAEIYIGRQALELWLRSRKVFTFEGWCPGEDSNLHALASAST